MDTQQAVDGVFALAWLSGCAGTVGLLQTFADFPGENTTTSFILSLIMLGLAYSLFKLYETLKG